MSEFQVEIRKSEKIGIHKQADTTIMGSKVEQIPLQFSGKNNKSN